MKKLLILIIPLIFISLINLVLGANPTFTNLQITPNPAYSNSLLNCSATYNDADSNKGNVTMNIWNGSTNYFNITMFNVMTGDTFNEPILYTPLDDIIEYYKFSEGNGTRTNGTKMAIPLVYVPSSTKLIWNRTNQIYGNYVTLNGTTDSFKNSTTMPILSTMNLSVSAWVYPDANLRFNSYLIQINKKFYMKITNTRQLTCCIRNETGQDACAETTTNPITSNSWNKLDCIVNDTDIMAYVNGVKLITTDRVGLINVSNTGMRIGEQSSTGNWYNGSIDELILWNRTFTEAEVLNNYLTTRPQNRGEIWNCSLNAIDSAGESSVSYSITSEINSLPFVSDIGIYPSNPFADNNLYCYYNYSDVNNDYGLNNKITWYKSSDGGSTYSVINTTYDTPFLLLHLNLH